MWLIIVMKKAAILTWCDNNGPTNYGQILQCYAMQYLVKKWGYNPVVIQYRKKDDRDLTKHFYTNKNAVGRYLNERYEKKYNIEELKKALLAYNQATKDRITIEYILIGGLNDTKECALELIEFLKDIKCNINLIPYNPVDDNNGFKKPIKKDMLKFKYLLEASGKKVTILLERGADIDAACG